jgi:hypothetical protein
MRSAKSSGIFNTSRFLGGNFGIALAVAVFAATGNVGGDRAFSVGFAAAITVSAALSLAAAIAALALPPKREVAMDQAKAEADAAMAPIMRSRFMTEGSKTPHPGVEAMRQFWDATLDRLAVFLQAKHHSDRHATPPPRPLKLPSRSDERN